MTKLITIALALVMTGQLHAQDSAYIKEIRAYTRHLDSLIEQRKGKSLAESIHEGPASAKHSEDAETKIYKGGFTLHSYETFRGDSIFRITYHDNLRKNRTINFYLRNNALVFACIELQDDPNKVLYRREEYYTGKDNPAITLLITDDLPEEYLWRVEFSLYKNFTQQLEFMDKKL